MEWDGMDMFRADLRRIMTDLPVQVAAGANEAAFFLRDRMLSNMDTYGIRRITGVSRDYITAQATPPTLGALAGSYVAYAGYLDWPADLVFYPKFLNDGTVKMIARPYFDQAYVAAETFFFERMDEAMSRAMGVP